MSLLNNSSAARRSLGAPLSLSPPLIMGALLSLTLFGLAACGSVEPADPLASASGFCDEWGQSVCTESVTRSCAAASVDDCRASQSQACRKRLPASSYTGQGAKACLAFVRDAYLDQGLDRTELDALFELGAPCDALISGNGSAGDECSANQDCSTAEGERCVERIPGEGGHCHVPKLVQGGGRCQDEASICIAGQYCNGANCIAEATENDECSDAVPCEDAFRCLIPEGDPTGSCEPKIETGDSCKTNTDCASGICDRNADETDGRCVDFFVLSNRVDVCEQFR